MKIIKKHICKLLFIVLLVVLVVILFLFKEDFRKVSAILSKGSLEELVAMMRNSKLAPFLSILLMILQSVIAPIPSFLIAGANGIVFGIVGGIFLSWIGAMLGAGCTFYLSRLLGEPFVRKFEKDSSLMRKVNEIGEKHGMKVILIGRLLPFVSFDFLSYAAGLSTIKASHFFLATGIGMLPGTALYVVVGNRIGAYSSYSAYITGAVILGIMIWSIYQWLKKRRQK